MPYRFDDRELGESKMSIGEAMGYLVQLRDLYWMRLTQRGRTSRSYERLSSARLAELFPSVQPPL